MKRENPTFDLARASAAAAEGGGRRFWSCLEELLDENEFRQWIAAEFPSAAAIIDDPGRRQFLKLMGASLLLAGLTGCGDNRADKALPYVNQPENAIPGVPRHYATAVLFQGYAQPVIATTYDGRPTKLDGNPDHPATRGKSDAFMQAAIFGLYDPERSKMPSRGRAPSTWEQFTSEIETRRGEWKQRGGDGLRLLTGATTSPTLIRQIGVLKQQFPGLRWHRYEPAGDANMVDGLRAAFGKPFVPHYRLDRSDVVVSIGHDLLGAGPLQVFHAGQWTRRRGETAPGDGRQRLHAAESTPGLTGVIATARLACNASRLPLLVKALATMLQASSGAAPPLDTNERIWLERAADDLQTSTGKSLLTIAPELAPECHATAALINEKLKNNGATVWYSAPLHATPDRNETLPALCEDMAAGSVETLIVAGSNPVYSAPHELNFSEKLKRVSNRIHAGLHFDETAQACDWHVPLHHALESWSDARAVDGTTTLLQPVIRPLYASKGVHELFDLLAGVHSPTADGAVRATWRDQFGGDFDARWGSALHEGFVAATAAEPVTLAAAVPPHMIAEEPADPAVLDIVFRADPSVWDGRFGNVAWLQELPKPLSKITWENVVAVSPGLAAERGLAPNDVVEVAVGERTIRGPIWIVPGQAKHTIGLTLGYGRSAGGEVAACGGYNAFALLPAGSRGFVRGTVHRVDGKANVATTQAHHRMQGFDFVREVTAKAPSLPEPHKAKTLYSDWPEGDHAWGMVIDLDRCIGCNACIAACNVENNVLVVGKDQVSRGREMLWLRVDRYYTGDIENPRGYFQPVPCMHCENAPCEMGCPVHATVHSPEGINQQVYNRCIGTRTCSSYCPYKVRRFNWYDYRKVDETSRAAQNPDVTVRSRGVMEKCTYCTQRIQAAHAQADKEKRAFRTDEVATACQQACPTEAIVFGDLKDPNSAVSKQRASGRHYVLLEELGTRPRTTYLARWNDSPEGEG